MGRRVTLAACMALLLGPVGVWGQDPVLEPDTMLIADTIPSELPSPRGAFVRGLLVPGWGHVYVEEYTRGAVYGSLQAASWFMLVRTLRRLDDVRDREERLIPLVLRAADSANAAAGSLAELVSREEALEADPTLRDTRKLVSAREQQRQDWITYTIFFTFAGAIDAYVTAHLKDFPADVIAQPGIDGRMNLGVQIPIGRIR